MIQFRRSYANQVSMSELELDSLEKSNPKFDLTFNDAKPELQQYLEKLGISHKTDLLLNKLDTLLQDTVSISESSEAKYSAFPILDINTNRTFLTIVGPKCRDSVYLDQSLTRPRCKIINFEPEKKRFLLVYWEYYFMNGDMFDIALIEIK